MDDQAAAKVSRPLSGYWKSMAVCITSSGPDRAAVRTSFNLPKSNWNRTLRAMKAAKMIQVEIDTVRLTDLGAAALRLTDEAARG